MVIPKIGWMVRVTETDEETLKQLEKLNSEWGITLRVKDVPEVMKELKHIKSLELEFTDEVTLPDWFFDADIKSLTIRGKMSEKMREKLKNRYPKGHLWNNSDWDTFRLY